MLRGPPHRRRAWLRWSKESVLSREFAWSSRMPRDECGVGLELRGDFGGKVISFRIGRKCSLAYRRLIALNPLSQQGVRIGKAANELRAIRKRELHQVVEDEYLSIAIGAGADADRGYRRGRRNARGNLARNAFEHQRTRVRAFQCCCVGEQNLDRIPRAPLHPIATHAMHRLRREADVSDHRDLGQSELLDQRGAVASTFNFHCLRAALVEQLTLAE